MNFTKRGILQLGLVAAVAIALVALEGIVVRASAIATPTVTNTSILGEQDYADGDIIGSNGTWLAIQAGEPYPFNTIHVAPQTITFTHTGLDSGRQGILTFSLWDLDSEFAGNQISAFSLDGIPQDISAFELSSSDLRTRLFRFSIDPSFLSDGELVVSLTFSGPPAGNEVGIDFSRVDVPSIVTAASVRRWTVNNGFFSLHFFGDGTLLAADDYAVGIPGGHPGSGGVLAAKLDPTTGMSSGTIYAPDVRSSVKLGADPSQDILVGGYANRFALDRNGSYLRLLRDLGCCNIPRFPLALDHDRNAAYSLSNGQLFGMNMTTGNTDYFYYGAGDTFASLSIANSNTLYSSGRSGNVTKLNPTIAGAQWSRNISTGDLQPSAIAADGSVVVTSGSPHFGGVVSPGKLARLLADGTIVFNRSLNAVTPPVIGSTGLIFIGTQPAPISENGLGSISAYDPAGNLVWTTPVDGLPNDLLVGDDGAVYAGTGGYGNGNIYAIGQSDGAIRQIVTDVESAWEIVLRAGLIYASGQNFSGSQTSITAIPVAANNYDPASSWPVRYHDNQRTSNRTHPILNPPRDPGPDPIAPLTSVANTPGANPVGWNNTDVSVALSAEDDAGGSGVDTITYSATGAQTIPSTTVSGSGANLTISAEGTTTITYFAEDNAGNVEPQKTLEIKIDKTAPLLDCGSPDLLWHAADVSIACTGTDSVSGLASEGDANFSLSTSVAEGTETSNASTGSRSVCDIAGNCATAGPIAGNKIDKKAPALDCGSPDGSWHAADVSIACTGSDTGSGLASAGDASFSLSTSVAAGTEISNASTGSRSVCDNVGNCSPAGPIAGNKVDKKAPEISITSPTGGTYLLNQAVAANYTCSDGGSGVANCTGTAANGSQIDTASTGSKVFSVSATDNVGNTATPATVSYSVAFGVVALYDQTRAHKSGSTIPIKIRLVDANGANVSSPALLPHAISVIQVSSQASTEFGDAGNSNPDFDFRYDAALGGYIFNLQTTGMGTGSYLLNFIAGSPTPVYSVGFQIRQ